MVCSLFHKLQFNLQLLQLLNNSQQAQPLSTTLSTSLDQQHGLRATASLDKPRISFHSDSIQQNNSHFWVYRGLELLPVQSLPLLFLFCLTSFPLLVELIMLLQLWLRLMVRDVPGHDSMFSYELEQGVKLVLSQHHHVTPPPLLNWVWPVRDASSLQAASLTPLNQSN